MAMARATSLRMDSSSSAISTRGIEHPSSASAAPFSCSYVAAGDVPLAEETDIDIAAFGGRRSQSRLEPGSFAWIEHGLLQQRIPGVDLGALRVANAEAQPRQFDRLTGEADDHALDYQHRFALHGFGCDLHILEGEAARIHLKADQLVECGGLRHEPHHVAAPDHQRQHQRAHGGADGRETDKWLARRAKPRLWS